MFSRALLLILCVCCSCLSAKWCRSANVTNRGFQQFDKFRNCTKIVGYLKVTLFHGGAVNFPTFPHLREVTGHVIVFALDNLEDLSVLFPKLVVIRGKELFRGNALVIHHNKSLKQIGLTNLRRIERGNVHIGKCPELCFVKTVNWSALGTSLSTYADVPSCKTEEVCNPECDGHCWAPGRCQRIFDNCHPECLGCSKANSSRDCLVCKNWKDGDNCVSSCSPNKYLNENSMSCVTTEECNNFKSMLSIPTWVFMKWCLRKNTCPENYQLVTEPYVTCKLCEGPCYKKCNGSSIRNKQHMQQLKGCTHIDGHLEFKVTNEYDVDHLEQNLINITEIDGCLKIVRADALSSLNFLRNLKRIGGRDKHKFCNNHTVWAYENINLKNLIDFGRIETGHDVSIGFENNPELCISEIRKFSRVLGISEETFEKMLQEEKDVSPYSNGDRAPCGELSLNVTVTESFSTNMTFRWRPYHSDNATVIAYTFYYILNTTLYEENNYNYDNIRCKDNGWRSKLIPTNNSTISGLEPFSIYAYWLKVYYVKNDRGISKSSNIRYFETSPEDPTPPMYLKIEPLSPNSVQLTWETPESTNGILSHYLLSAFQEHDDVSFIDERNYCVYPHVKIDKMPVKPTEQWINETDNGVCVCNPRILKLDGLCGAKSTHFTTKNCNDYLYQLEKGAKKRVLRAAPNYKSNDSTWRENIHIPSSEKMYILDNLKPFSKYIFWFSACNQEYKGKPQCSPVLFSWARTLANSSADQVTSIHVKIFNGNTVSLRWIDPPNPNGMIVAYNIEYKSRDGSVNVHDCVTRTQYVASGYVYRIENMDPGEYALKLRPVTLNGAGKYSEHLNFQIKTPLKSWIVFLICGIVFAVLLTSFILYMWYKKKTKADRVYLITNVNPEYSRAVYIEEGWEMERDDVEMSEILGQGSFGVVYSGVIKSQNLLCAVKTVNDPAAVIHRTEFLKEALVMRSFCDAHHVIKLYGVVSKDDPPLVIMELMERGDLKQYLRNARKNPKSISLPEMYQMAAQIADGMTYLSAKKYVHRDLAARNCMVASDRTVKIGDFGMTKDIYETDYYRKGTSGLLPVRWMAPESLSDGVFSSESDVWSYGIVLWEMVTFAEHPYQGMSNEQVLKFVTTRGRLGRPKDCPNVLWEIMEVCWEHKPSKRPLFIGIVEKLEPLSGQSFPLVSFYHSQAGQNYRMNYGRQESLEITANNYNQTSYLREEDDSTLMDNNFEDDDEFNLETRNRKLRIINSDSLTWPSSNSISSQTP